MTRKSIIAAFFIGILFIGSQLIEQPPIERTSLLDALEQSGYSLAPVSLAEKSLLQAVLSSEQDVLRSTGVLKNNDRLAAVYWVQSPQATLYMQKLTEKSFRSFSENVTHIIDDVIASEDHLPIDVLAFTDPSIAEERIIFAQIEDTLYEFHVAKSREAWVQGLLLQLSRMN